MNSKKKLLDVLMDADKNGWAVNSFNFTDVWDMLSLVEAAEELNAPVILMVHPENFAQETLKMCGAMAKQAAEEAKVPVFVHLDHSTSIEDCKTAVDAGFDSVMIDASYLSLEENIARTKEVVDYAHAKGVIVEAEMGRIKGGGVEGGYYGDDFLAQVSDCKALVEATGVDMLAVGIGTQHGFYTAKPELNFQRLKEIKEACPIPLVLHGGTGVPAEQVKEGIALGLDKINVGTCIATTYMVGMRDELNAADEHPFTIDIVGPVKEKVKAVAKEWFEVCGAVGKA